jgi:hypothetical protein
MQNYKERIKKLRQAEDSEEFVLKSALTIFSNEEQYHQIMDDYKSYYGKDPKILNSIMELYKLYYKLAKDHFVIEAKIEKISLIRKYPILNIRRNDLKFFFYKRSFRNIAFFIY